MNFREELLKRGAREFQIVALSGDEDRALAAIAEAERRGVDNPIPYALTLYDDPTWTGKGRPRGQATNLSVERECAHCGGNRMALVTDEVLELYGETWAPCIVCNKSANTEFWTARGSKFTATPQ